VTRDDLVLRDMALLEETRQAIEGAVSGTGPPLPRNPQWGRTYNPLRIIFDRNAKTAHFQVALINVRIAMHMDEQWAKCANCGRLYLVGESGETVCSAECSRAYDAYLSNQ
jgi:hypothetical protein